MADSRITVQVHVKVDTTELDDALEKIAELKRALNIGDPEEQKPST